MHRFLRHLILACLVASATGVQGTDARQEKAGGAAGLFDADDMLDLTLTMDLKAVARDKDDDRPYRPATLSYTDSRGTPVSIDVRVKTRGHFRLRELNCQVPPLRLNFKQATAEDTIFAGQTTLKLVTHCKDAYEQYVLQEYLAYKIYNLLTEKSFRVRRVRITYADAAGKSEPVTRPAFFIEHEDRMAARNGGQIIENVTYHQQQTDPELTTLLAVFQYMIGNTDWVASQGHNVTFLYTGAATRPIVVPYDFDMAGFINASYAVPNPGLRLRSVQERRFMGVCRTDEAFAATFALFDRRRAQIYALFRDLEPLEKTVADRSLKYFDTFYDVIHHPGSIAEGAFSTCLQAGG